MDEHLQEVYGHASFRPHQREIIGDLMSLHDVFVVMPTGGGKSLLYQFCASFTGKKCVVVSPLISLMNDQAIALEKLGIKTVCLNSETTQKDRARLSEATMIYVTPEHLTGGAQDLRDHVNDLCLIAIDEAHCISQWSHDFRPAYKKLGAVASMYPSVPLLAVTATATPKVLTEMKELLARPDAKLYSTGTRRANLCISVKDKADFDSCTFDVPTIVYVQTRKVCEELCQKLITKGVTCCAYHGGLCKRAKSHAHLEFIAGRVMAVIATISFGMGIDKANIRHVVNYGVPNDLETYYQEIGRAGRDGKESRATIYFAPADFATANFLISTCGCPRQRRVKQAALRVLRSYLSNHRECRQALIEQYFATGALAGASELASCQLCDNCTGKDEGVGEDVSAEMGALALVVDVQYKQQGYGVGITRTIKTLAAMPLFRKRKKTWVRALVEEALARGIVKQVEVRGKKGLIIHVLAKGIFSLQGGDTVRLVGDRTAHKSTSTQNSYTKSLQDALHRYRTMVALRRGVPPEFILSDDIICRIVRANQDIHTPPDLPTLRERAFMPGHIPNLRDIVLRQKTEARSSRNQTLQELYKAGTPLASVAATMKCSPQEIGGEFVRLLETDDSLEIDCEYLGLTADIEEKIAATESKLGCDGTVRFVAVSAGVPAYLVELFRLVQSLEA